jgi:hypothetical protein
MFVRIRLFNRVLAKFKLLHLDYWLYNPWKIHRSYSWKNNCDSLDVVIEN